MGTSSSTSRDEPGVKPTGLLLVIEPNGILFKRPSPLPTPDKIRVRCSICTLGPSSSDLQCTENISNFLKKEIPVSTSPWVIDSLYIIRALIKTMRPCKPSCSCCSRLMTKPVSPPSLCGAKRSSKTGGKRLKPFQSPPLYNVDPS